MGLDLPAGVFTEDLGVQARLSAEEIFARITALDHDTLGSGHHPDCGSGAGGDRRSWEDTPEVAQGAEIAEAIARKVARAIVSAGTRGGDSGHGAHGGAPGTIPGAWTLWAEEVLEDRIDWRTQLAKLTRRALVRQGATDYTTRRLARRDADPFVLASMAAPAPPRCVAVVDTSGSIDKRELGTALAELASLVRALRGQPIDVVLCDTAATVVRRVLEPRALELRGGGGTDLRVGIAAAAELRPAADLVVVVTDGFTPWPAVPPAANRRAIYLAVLLASAPAPPPFIWTVSVPSAAASAAWPDIAGAGRVRRGGRNVPCAP
jgi:hypothetical protein